MFVKKKKFMQCGFQLSEILNPAAFSTSTDNKSLAAEPVTSRTQFHSQPLATMRSSGRISVPVV